MTTTNPELEAMYKEAKPMLFGWKDWLEKFPGRRQREDKMSEILTTARVNNW